MACQALAHLAQPYLAHLVVSFMHFLSHLSVATVPPTVPPPNPSVHFWPCPRCCCGLEGSLPRNSLGSLPSSLVRPRFLQEDLPDHSTLKVSVRPSIPGPTQSALPFLSFQSTCHLLTQLSKVNVHAVHLVNLLNPDSEFLAWGRGVGVGGRILSTFNKVPGAN